LPEADAHYYTEDPDNDRSEKTKSHHEREIDDVGIDLETEISLFYWTIISLPI
jgi:hypothetical protein